MRISTEFHESLGVDKPIEVLTRHDAVAFREWWQNKLETNDLEIGTANKDFGHMNCMYTAVGIANHLNLPPVLAGCAFTGKRRASVKSSPWVGAAALLVPGAPEVMQRYPTGLPHSPDDAGPNDLATASANGSVRIALDPFGSLASLLLSRLNVQRTNSLAPSAITAAGGEVSISR